MTSAAGRAAVDAPALLLKAPGGLPLLAGVELQRRRWGLPAAAKPTAWSA